MYAFHICLASQLTREIYLTAATTFIHALTTNDDNKRWRRGEMDDEQEDLSPPRAQLNQRIGFRSSLYVCAHSENSNRSCRKEKKRRISKSATPHTLTKTGKVLTLAKVEPSPSGSRVLVTTVMQLPREHRRTTEELFEKEKERERRMTLGNRANQEKIDIPNSPHQHPSRDVSPQQS